MKQGPREDKSNDGGSPRQHRRGRVLQIELPRGRRGGREGEEEEEEDEMKELQKRIEKAKLPEHALKAALKELKVNAMSYKQFLLIFVVLLQPHTVSWLTYSRTL